MRVIGICRFSYPAEGGFKRMHDSLAAREAYLYAPKRMELRFRHFECLTLPSIAAQQNRDFTFLIVVGQSLPKPYRTRLHDLTAPVPQIRIVEQPPCATGPPCTRHQAGAGRGRHRLDPVPAR